MFAAAGRKTTPSIMPVGLFLVITVALITEAVFSVRRGDRVKRLATVSALGPSILWLGTETKLRQTLVALDFPGLFGRRGHPPDSCLMASRYQARPSHR